MNKTLAAWQVAILAACLQLIGGIILYGFTRSANNNDTWKKQVEVKVEVKADKDYVDKQDKALKDDIGTVKIDVDKTINRIDDNLKEIRSYILKTK